MSDLPVVEPSAAAEGGAAAGGARVAGVLLAAGTSSRFGDANKLLEPVDGQPMVRRSVATLLDSGLAPVVVVLGHEAERVRDALSGLDLAFVENPHYAEGQATSVRAGVEALPDDADAAVFALGDMPWVAVGTVRLLVDAYRAGQGSALAAALGGVRGNPVLWDAAHFDALADRTGDVGGRDLLLSIDDAALVETGDPGVRRDVDRPDELG